MDTIRPRIAELKDEIVALRRDFHTHPELGCQEFRTASVIEQYLQDIGLETTRIAGTGVVAVIEGQSERPVFMLRADMDALPICETTDAECISSIEGVMHACGHDAHMAMLLVAAKILVEQKTRIQGTVKLVFQPNEEINGAQDMIRAGVLENPTVDGALGIHIWSQLPSRTVAVTSGPVMGGLDVFKLVIRGVGGHTGFPEEAIDPVIAAAHVIMAVQTIQTREISSFLPTTIMFGKIEGGTKSNIIPEELCLEGSIRYLYPGPDCPDHPTQRFQRIVQSVCDTHRCSCEINLVRENIPLINDPGMTRIASLAVSNVLDHTGCMTTMQTIASEDFSEFSARVPSVFLFLGCGDPEKGTDIPHHNPCFLIDEDVLPLGVEIFISAVLEFFKYASEFSEIHTEQP
ncbi:MAG: amidohydrolase [Desulfosalsimonadaceae bacterium]